jgi:hypothetical protein
MNSPESESEVVRPSQPASAPATVEDLQRRYESLQTLFHAALVALIILSLGVSLFILKQMRLLSAQLTEQRPMVSRLMADYQKTSEPLIRRFTSALDRFAVSNRDFQPILEKYRPVLKDYFTAAPASPSTTAPASTQAAPAGTPAPKP